MYTKINNNYPIKGSEPCPDLLGVLNAAVGPVTALQSKCHQSSYIASCNCNKILSKLS